MCIAHIPPSRPIIILDLPSWISCGVGESGVGSSRGRLSGGWSIDVETGKSRGQLKQPGWRVGLLRQKSVVIWRAREEKSVLFFGELKNEVCLVNKVVSQSLKITTGLKVGWRGKFVSWLIRISVSENLPESNKSSYWARDVVKNTLKSWNSQMNSHSFEIFPRDVNCRKRRHSGSTLLHMHACAIGSQSPTSTTLSHFWILESKYEHEMGPKTKTKTYVIHWV